MASVMDLVIEKLKQLYYDIRVDHLNEDELDFELDIRDILFDNNESISRRRKALREILKTEKSEVNPNKSLKQNPATDLHICLAKLNEIEETIRISSKSVPSKCQSRLLHLGSRLILLESYVEAEDREEIGRISWRRFCHT